MNQSYTIKIIGRQYNTRMEIAPPLDGFALRTMHANRLSNLADNLGHGATISYLDIECQVWESPKDVSEVALRNADLIGEVLGREGITVETVADIDHSQPF